MSKENNLTDFLTDLGSAIKDKRGTGNPINAQDFADEVRAIEPLLDTLDITENGEHDVKDYKNVNVLVQSDGDIKLQELIEGTSTNFEIPYGVTKITDNAFNGRDNLTFTFADSSVITEIGANAFKCNSASKKIINVDFPNCETIGEYAFSQRMIQENINLPKVTNIPNYAFNFETSYAGYFSNVNINCENVESVGMYAFYGRTNYSGYEMKINLPKCKTINARAFSNNIITEIILPEVKTLGATCFLSDSINGGIRIEKFYMFANVESIGTNAFSNNKAFKEVYFNDKCKEITGETIFNGCSNLEKIFLNNGLQTIGKGFLSGTGVETITIPSSVTSINNQFYSSKKVTYTFESTTPCTITSSTFSTSYLNKIFVPVGTSATYKSATNWSRFADYIVEPNEIVFNVPSALLNNENYTYSLDNGKTYQQFINSVISLNNISTLKIKSLTADTTILIGTTSGGNDIGTISNSELTYNTSGDTTIYLTIQ